MRLFYVTDARIPTEKAHGYQIVKMCEAFAACGIETHLVVPRRRNPLSEDPFDYYGVPRSFQIHYLPVTDLISKKILSRLPFSLIARFFLMRSFLSTARVFAVSHMQDDDVLYTRSWEVAFFFRSRKSLVWEVHEITRLERFTPGLYARMAGIVVLTRCLKDMIGMHAVPSERILIAPDAVDLSAFSDLPPISEARRRLKIPFHRVVIGYVGMLTLHGGRAKGISELLMAFASLKSRAGDPLLVIAGGPPSAVVRYAAEARALGVADAVIFAGQIPRADVPLWMRACDILAIPWPRTEFSACFTSPLKLFEYMASGKPIVASDLPSLRDVLNERIAVFAPPGDSAGIAAACRRLIDDPSLRDRLGSAARTAAAPRTWNARAESIRDFIEKITALDAFR